MLQGVRVEDAQVYQFPGRQVSYLVGPKTTDAKNVTVGLCVWPQGGQPYHVHTEHEETIYIISGPRGDLLPRQHGGPGAGDGGLHPHRDRPLASRASGRSRCSS